jgi:hypothetical protein
VDQASTIVTLLPFFHMNIVSQTTFEICNAIEPPIDAHCALNLVPEPGGKVGQNRIAFQVLFAGF